MWSVLLYMQASNGAGGTMMHMPLDILGLRSPVVVLNTSAHGMLLEAGKAADIVAGILAVHIVAGILVAAHLADAPGLRSPVTHNRTPWHQKCTPDLAGRTNGQMHDRVVDAGVDSGKTGKSPDLGLVSGTAAL